MTGLFLLAVLIGWILGSFLLAKLLTRGIASKMLRGLVGLAIVAGLLVLLVADELIGKHQFQALCDQNSNLKIDAEKARGKNIRLVIAPVDEEIPGTALPILRFHLSFRIDETNEEVAQFDRYVVKGGWFIHLLGISENNSPLTLGRPYCEPPMSAQRIGEKYGFKVIN